MTLHEISTGDSLVWVLDEDSGQATKTICEETGAQFRGALPQEYQLDAKTLADFVLPRQSANLRAKLAHAGAAV